MNIKRTVIASSLVLGMTMQVSAALSAKSYISTGLIDQWDAKENVDYGVPFDPAATVWKDLVGSADYALTEKDAFVEGEFRTSRNTEDNTGSAGVENDAFLSAFVSATPRYSVEIAFDMTEAVSVVGTGDNKQLDAKMLVAGYNGYWFGTQANRYIGFNANSETTFFNASKNAWQANPSVLSHRVDMGASGALGQHVASFVQDGADWRIEVDGSESASGIVATPTNAVTTTHKFILNRGYYRDTGMTGKFHSIRIYDRPLTEDEVKVNRAVDQVRFFGSAASDDLLPDGWHFDTDGGEIKLMRQFAIAANVAGGGLVSVNGETAAESVAFGLEQGVEESAELQLSATASDGYQFWCWRGVASGDDVRQASGTFVVTGNVTAVFYKTGPHKLSAKSYISTGLVNQWDAQENVAYGQYDGSSKEWCDLVGGVNYSLTENDAFGEGEFRTTRNTEDLTYAAGVANEAFLSAFITESPHYTVEISFDMTEAVSVVGTGDNKQLDAKMLVAGYNGYWFGTQGNRYLGFNANSETKFYNATKKSWQGNASQLSHCVDMGVNGVLGPHTASFAQDGADWRVAVDGSKTAAGVVASPTNAVSDAHKFILNRGYYKDTGMTGKYHVLRIYDRALTEDEVAVNRAVDQVRFFGADPAAYTLPDGWRFGLSDGIALERKHAVSSTDGEMGMVSVGAGAPAASTEAWVDVAAPTVTLTATPRKGFKFKRWTGAITGSDLKAATGIFTVTGAVQAEFKEETGLILLFR